MRLTKSRLTPLEKLAIFRINIEKQTGPKKGCPGEQSCKKELCRERIALVPRAPRMHSGGRV